MNQRAVFLSVLAGASICAAAPARAVECFSIYDARNTLVYQAPTSPIDLSRSIGDQMARRFPSNYLVIADASPCRPVGRTAPGANAASLLSSSRDSTGSPPDGDYIADPYTPPQTSISPVPTRAGRAAARAAAGRR